MHTMIWKMIEIQSGFNTITTVQHQIGENLLRKLYSLTGLVERQSVAT